MKKVKGFTLLECIVAMAIIGVTSLLMVQVYGTVARMTSDNNRMNNSIERQMQYAEKQLSTIAAEDNGVVKVRRLSSYASGTDVVGSVHKIKIVQNEVPTGSSFDVATSDASAVEAEVDLYVIGIEVESASTSEYGRGSGSESYDDNNLRYKFITAKPHPSK